MKKITLKLFRYNPETDTKPHYDTYKLEVEPTDRVLDLLERIKGYEDGTLSFRRSCAHGVCGSCAMRVNGENKLACKTLMQDLSGNKVVVEPILGLPVKKDLIVDMEPFFINYKSVMPYFINNGSQPEKEHIQSIEEQERFDDTAKCILCGACTTSCPSFWSNDEYVGPAAIVNAHRLFSTAATKAPQNVCKFSMTNLAFIVAVPSSTAPLLARVKSKSPKLSAK